MPSYDDGGKPDFETATTDEPPRDVEPAIPPYEGRKETADVGDAEAGGATASPAQEQPASQASETDRDDDAVGPAHASGTGRAEDKR